MVLSRWHAGLTGALAAALLSGSAPAAGASVSAPPFDARVALGEAAERGEQFRDYQAALDRQVGPRFAQAMRACFAAIREPDTTAFVLVADIGAEGTPSAIEAEPGTNIALCFAAGVARMSFPQPPPFPGRDGFPITIRMRIAD